MTWHLVSFAVWALVAISSPNLAFTDQYGSKHDLNQFTATFTIIEFSASWSKGSWLALPELEKLAKSFPQCDVIVLNEDEDVRRRDDMVRTLNLSIPVIWDKGHFLAERLEPAGLPATLILDREGNIVYQQVGYSRKKWHELSAMLEKLLNEKEKTR